MYARVHLRRNFTAAKATWKLLTATANDRPIGRAPGCMFNCVWKTIAKTSQNPMLKLARTNTVNVKLANLAVRVGVDGRVWLFGFALIARPLHNFQTQSQYPISIIRTECVIFIRLNHKQECHRWHWHRVAFIHEWIHRSKIEGKFGYRVLSREILGNWKFFVHCYKCNLV